jgi:threonine/homoserine/homoserine lactone efflux protein
VEPLFFLKGLVIGFAMTVPIGPIGIMCIRKTLVEGHPRGLIVGLGAATADSLYGGAAALGLTFVSDAIASQHFWMCLVGGGVLMFLGIRTLRVTYKKPLILFNNKGLMGSYLSAFVLALSNPVTIFAFIAVFAAFGLGHRLVVISACALVLGVFTGSCLWFLTLGYITTLFRQRLDAGGLRWVNRVAGILIILSGIAAFVSLILALQPSSFLSGHF